MGITNNNKEIVKIARQIAEEDLSWIDTNLLVLVEELIRRKEVGKLELELSIKVKEKCQK